MLSVMLGAFAAHGLRGRLDARLVHAFETGVTYQLFHSIMLFLVGLAMLAWGRHWTLTASALAFLTGIFLFSGSLYLLSLTGLKWLGPVTPLGGLFLIAGWLLLALGAWMNAGRALQ